MRKTTTVSPCFFPQELLKGQWERGGGGSEGGGYLRPQPPAPWMLGVRPVSLYKVPRGVACFVGRKIGFGNALHVR